MKQHSFKWKTTADRRGWTVHNAVTDIQLAMYALRADDSGNAALYGLKQLIGDGGALSDGATAAKRLAAMDKRYTAYKNGTWEFRDGHGATTKMPDAILYAACVGAGLLADNAVSRAAWIAASPAYRAGRAVDPRIQQWLAANAATSGADAALAALFPPADDDDQQ